MTTFFKTGEASNLSGVPQNTIRDWRSKSKDFSNRAEANGKDEKYTRRGLLSLGVMKVARQSGASLDEAFSIAFWSIDEISHWLDIWDMPAWAPGQNVVVKETTKARWYFSDGQSNPIVTDDASYISQVSTFEDGNCMVMVFDLWAIARNLPDALVKAVRQAVD